MARLTAPKRRRGGAKRLDITRLRDLLKDKRVWVSLAVVTVPEDESSHWFYQTAADGTLQDIMVDVVTAPDNLDLTCRLGGGAGSQGIWTIPAVGDEVMVAVPHGDIAFQPAIIGLLSSNLIANPAGQGPAASRTVIVNGEVLVHDGNGGAVALALKSDVQDLVDDFNAHTHGTGVGPSGTPSTGTPPITASDPTGTTILKAK